MFTFWSEGPRTWKWLVPAICAVLSVPIVYTLWSNGSDKELVLAVTILLGDGLLVWAAGTNWWKLTSKHQEDLFRDHAEALSVTPTVLLAKFMQQMHPEAVRVLDKFGVRTVWGVSFSRETMDRDWVLLDTSPAVHFGFIEYVLSKSGKTLYPKHRFSDGSKKWDPDGIAYDRDQYDEFEKWGRARLIWTRSMGEYKPAEFIPPWTPQLLMQVMGFSGEQDLYRPEDVVVKELPAEKPKQKAEEQKADHGRQNGEPALTADEEEDLQNEWKNYAGMYASGKAPS